ncbi:hypothetical protein [Gimesia panareensis]|uniref:hypothetical protein n=1 Tax=Gimesia panareensis TaxID=2527978 RepID=UPI00118C7585|nr:hypothetical protein [Gimesia panareensis]QDU49801.1 hypothetical protein Pan110_21400 [Gimesia panareensis]
MQNLTRDEVAAKLWELNLELSPEITYRLETLFPRIEGWFVKGKIKEQFKLLKRLEPLLTEILLEHEEVQLVLPCNQSTLTDAFLMGSLWVGTSTCAVLVLTNLRIYCIRVNDTGVPQQSFWQIYYSQIKVVDQTLFGDALFSLKDGRRLIYSGIVPDDQKRMQFIVWENCKLFRKRGFEPDVSQSREQLCGHCFDVIPPGIYECESCGAQYWKPIEVGIRSFVFPSWGDFVMKHSTLAFMELLGFTFLIGFTVAAFLEGRYVAGLMLYVTANMADALMSVQLATRALHLKSTPFERPEMWNLYDPDRLVNEPLEAGPDYTGYRVADVAEQL